MREQYERLVTALGRKAADMRGQGHDDETIARTLHAERRALGERFKAQTPEPLRSLIDRRTRARYGDPLGPTIDYLRNAGKSWDAIIESASRPGTWPPEFDPADAQARKRS